MEWAVALCNTMLVAIVPVLGILPCMIAKSDFIGFMGILFYYALGEKRYRYLTMTVRNYAKSSVW